MTLANAPRALLFEWRGSANPVFLFLPKQEWSAGRRQGVCETPFGGPMTLARRALTTRSGYPEGSLSERAGPVT